MSKKEILAYAITHAPPGVKGGPYEGCGAIGGSTAHLGCALRWPDAGGRMWARDALASVRRSVPTARVIRIVRARPSAEPTQQPSEASAVAVLREYIRWVDNMTGGRSTGEGSEDGGPWRAYGEPTDQELVDAFEHAYSNAPSVRTHATAIRTIYRLGVAHELATIAMRARRVLAEAGPDPSKVVRAAMRRRYERDAHLDQARAGRGGTTRLWEAAENDEDAAVDAYRKAGGTP